ncbi:Protein IN2-1-like B [Cucurbita argyrosperma subsp. argyrosperma]|nr:Protein IN2-1-like B [Cucurbita argyrosperma subsp. argyrosperma]
MATWTLGSSIGVSQPSSCSDASVHCIPFSSRRLSFSSIIISPLKLQRQVSRRTARPVISVKMSAAEAFQEVLPPALTSASEPPPIFDGTTRLYISYSCPYAQRVWITRNCKVPALEHNNEVKGESLDLIRYIDSNFEGPSLFPEDQGRREFAEELMNYLNSFRGSVEMNKVEGYQQTKGDPREHVDNFKKRALRESHSSRVSPWQWTSEHCAITCDVASCNEIT